MSSLIKSNFCPQSDDANESVTRKGIEAANLRSFLSGNPSAHYSQTANPLSGDGFFFPYYNSLHQPQVVGDQCFNAISSESDDVWSEPDRDESRARIGLDDQVTAFVPITHNAKAKSKNKHKRRSSGENYSLNSLNVDCLAMLSDIHCTQLNVNECA